VDASPPIERRSQPRYPLAQSVDFWHAPSRRRFPARCADLSRGGARLHLPAAAPLAPGQGVRLRIGGADGPELLGLGGRELRATVVRVDRQSLLADGCVTVGLRFAEA